MVAPDLTASLQPRPSGQTQPVSLLLYSAPDVGPMCRQYSAVKPSATVLQYSVVKPSVTVLQGGAGRSTVAAVELGAGPIELARELLIELGHSAGFYS